MTIHTLGPAGTFSHEATLQIFPKEAIAFSPNFDRVFDELMKSPGDVGIVPLENSLHGSVDEILDLLRETDVKIWQAHDVKIKHAVGAIDPARVTKVASHPQALRQSRLWLRKHLPDAEHLPMTSTAAAVDRAKGDPTIAAIASPSLITASGLKLISKDVEGKDNTTRFAVVSVNDPFPGSKRSHMSIAIHPPKDDRPGLLHQLLTPFKIYDVNLTRIENRPTGKRLGDYNFFVDFMGSPDDARTKKLLLELSALANVRILGEW